MNAMMNLNVTLPLGVVQPANGFSPPATSPPEGYKRQGSWFQEQGGGVPLPFTDPIKVDHVPGSKVCPASRYGTPTHQTKRAET